MAQPQIDDRSTRSLEALTPPEATLVAPTSFAQQRLWVIEQFLGEAHYTYNMPMTIRFEGQLDVTVLRRVLSEIVQRHATLRTTFRTNGGQPVQVIAPELHFDVPLIDLSEHPAAEREAETEHLLLEAAQHYFDLEQGPLLLIKLLRLVPKTHILAMTMHHIIADGWSIGVLRQELCSLYEVFSRGQPSPLPPLPTQYADFAERQQSHLQGKTLERQLRYWRKQLGDNPPPLELPTDYPRPPTQTYQGGRSYLTIPPTMVAALKALSQEMKASLFMTLLAAFKILLYRYTGQTDLSVGTPTANRNQTDIEPLIGFFANTLVLRTDLSGNPTFRNLLKQVWGVCLDAYSYQDIPFEKLVAELQNERDLSRSPFFQVMLALQNASSSSVVELPGLKLYLDGTDNGTAKFDLLLNLQESETGLKGYFNYNSDLFDETTIERMAGHYQMLLEGIVADPDMPISQLPLLTKAEQQTLAVWNAPQRTFPADRCLHRWFEAQVQANPDAIALTFEQTALSYADLNRQANQLAHHLQALSVKPGDLIGLCLDRSPEMLVGILGILKAGAAYLPLDPAVPPARLSFILEDAQASILLTQQSLTEAILNYQGQIIYLDTDWPSIAQHDPTNPTSPVTPDDLAYVIYTSGSTGKPKGVLVTHANVARLMTATAPWFHFNADDVWTLFHSYAFDFSVWEIWGALCYGGRLVIVPYWVSRSPDDFYNLLVTEGVTVLNQTPSAFRQLIQAEARLGVSDHLALRYVIFGGEALEMQSLKPWFDLHGDQQPQLINMYGITETTVHVTYRPLTAADVSSGSVIGRPIPDLQVYILDAHHQPVPIGVIGQMYVGGAGVTRGYLNRPELTAERFIPDPFRDLSDARLYKTGDLARYRPDGDIEYLGRIDHQVQLRGFRIELGEIESVLTEHPAIREVVVMAREDTPGDQRLVAYIVPTSQAPAPVNEWRIYLKDKLPDYMIPAIFVTLEHFPLTINGKIDRRALPVPDFSRPDLADTFVMPNGPVEEMLAEVWQAVLGIESISTHDNFFQLGGHSLLATQVIARLRDEYDIDLSLRTLFESPTVAELAAVIEAMLMDEMDEIDEAD